MLYDEYDKLLDSRFLKKDDIIKSGESLVFDSYLVDIGEQCRDCKYNTNLNHHENEIKIKVEDCSSPSTISKSQNKRSTFAFGKPKAPVSKTCLSPSQKIIRDFKRNEVDKYNSSGHSFDTTEPMKTEWQVLYTTQLTQRAKKFHDGILQLVVRGSQRQIMLCDATRTQLDQRFLKKDETVCSGETLKLDGHLVEIGEQEIIRDSVAGTDLVGEKVEPVRKTGVANNNKKFSAGRSVFKTPPPLKPINTSDSSINADRGKSSSRILADEPTKRGVNEILSTLKKPIQKKHVAANNSSDAIHSSTKDHQTTKECPDELSVKNPIVEVGEKTSNFGPNQEGCEEHENSTNSRNNSH